MFSWIACFSSHFTKKKEQAKEVKCGIFWQGRDRLLWAQILQHVKPANKTRKSALQLQRWKQKKLGGSGNRIRGGANVLNLSKVTRYLPPPYGPAPAVIQHWCFHRAAAAALSRSPLGGNWEAVALQRPLLLDVCLESPQRPKRWRCGRRQSQKRACMWNGIWTQRQESETSAVTSVYKFIHVTCCAALSSRRDAEILLHTDASLYAAGAQSHKLTPFPQAGTKNNSPSQCGGHWPSAFKWSRITSIRLSNQKCIYNWALSAQAIAKQLVPLLLHLPLVCTS